MVKYLWTNKPKVTLYHITITTIGDEIKWG